MKKILTTEYEDEYAIDIESPNEILGRTIIGFGLSIFFIIMMCL